MTTLRRHLRRWIPALAGVLLACSQAGTARAASAPPAEMERGFQAPPDSAKPWVYWWWHNGNMDEETITRDLTEMKAKGIGGVLMFDSRGYHQHYLPPPPPRNEFLDKDWRRLVKFAVVEANRLGLQMSMNLSTHAGSLKAPWPLGDRVPKKLVWTATEVSGPGRISGERQAPSGGRVWEIAVLAVRHGGGAAAAPAGAGGAVTLSSAWQEAVITPPKSPAAPLAEVVDLTASVDAAGRFSWNAPAGRWTILRFAFVCIPGHEYGIDVLNAAAVEEYFRRMAGPILSDAGPLVGRSLTHFYSVSWEGAAPTWTEGFDKEFLKYRGYSIVPQLPVLAGMTVGSRAASERFLADFSRTVSDCFLNNCYGKLWALCNKAGIKWHSESGGPWGRDLLFTQADELEFWARNDWPQGEFWQSAKADPAPGTARANTRRTATAGHIYGKPIIAAESFTHMLSHWIMYPARLKPTIDDVFIDGVNHVIWHTFSASPREFGKPGIIYWAGTHLNPNVTWWEQSGAFLKYLARCQYMLRQGRFVGDLVVYTSHRNNTVWTHDEQWSKTATLSPPKGYKHDAISREALLERLSVRNGRLVLPDGMSYRVLVVDPSEEITPPEVLEKVVSLAKSGATVILGRRRPSAAVSLKDADKSDARVRQAVTELWGDGKPGRRALGKGAVIQGTTVEEALKREGLAPDFEGPFQYTHRHGAAGDIYFLSGTGSAECTFRINGKAPEFWDPVTGRVRTAESYRKTGDGRMAARVELPKNGSVFVVFRKPAAAPPPPAPRPQTPPLALEGPWEVRFASGWGAPERATFDRLTPWDESSQEGIKYFSGTATYHKTFEVTAAQARQPARLALGEVKYIASVKLNGKPLGVVWTDPWTVDLAGALKAGTNTVEIAVTNLWVNRLIGDASLPEDKRFTKTHARREPGKQYPRPNLAGYAAGDPLVRSGLMGPVRIEFGGL